MVPLVYLSGVLACSAHIHGGALDSDKVRFLLGVRRQYLTEAVPLNDNTLQNCRWHKKTKNKTVTGKMPRRHTHTHINGNLISVFV